MIEMLKSSSEPIRLASMHNAENVATIVKAVLSITAKWSLTDAEAAALFGVSIIKWNRMKSGSYIGFLDKDNVYRASLILGLFKSLGERFGGKLSHRWIKLPNKGPLFLGHSPIDFMIAGNVPSMIIVRRHLESF